MTPIETKTVQSAQALYLGNMRRWCRAQPKIITDLRKGEGQGFSSVPASTLTAPRSRNYAMYKNFITTKVDACQGLHH